MFFFFTPPPPPPTPYHQNQRSCWKLLRISGWQIPDACSENNNDILVNSTWRDFSMRFTMFTVLFIDITLWSLFSNLHTSLNLTGNEKVRGSSPGSALMISLSTLLLSVQVLNGYPVGCKGHWNWHAPQGVENVHRNVQKIESSDHGDQVNTASGYYSCTTLKKNGN